MWYEDLTTHSFGGVAISRTTIGWLGKDKPFTKGETPRAVYEKLCELNENSWSDYFAMGWHECEFCPEAEFSNPYPETYCSRNLTIPYKGKLYHYPALITHYIKKHSYLPPEEFCEAVLACPPMNSIEYYNKMMEFGEKRLVSCFDELWAEIKNLQK